MSPLYPRSPLSLIFGSFIFASLSLSAASAIAQITLEALTRDGYGMVPIKRPLPNVLTVSARVNGRALRLVVDTGWDNDGITLDNESASGLHLPTEAVTGGGRSVTGKELSVRKGTADVIELGNVKINGVPLFVGRFDSLHNQQERRSVAADGFMGSGFLRTCSAVVDLHNLRLYLRPPGTGHRALLGPALKGAGLAECPFTREGNHNCLVDVEINGAAGKMIIDTGATFAGVDTRFAPQMKVAGYSSRTGMVGAAGELVTTELARLRSFKIGGLSVRAPDLRMSKYDFYSTSGGKVIGLLGMDILGPNGSIIDFSQQKLYFYALP